MSAFEVVEISIKAFCFTLLVGACIQHFRGYDDEAVFYMSLATFMLVWRLM